jgi:hypothetical protein
VAEQAFDHPLGAEWRREIGLGTSESDIVNGVESRAARAGIKGPDEGGGEQARGDVEVFGAGEQAHQLGAKIGLIAEGGGLLESGDEGEVFLGAGDGKILAHHKNFFGMAGGEVGGGGGDPAGFFAHGEGVPRLADAVAVNGAGGEVAVELGRGHDDDADVFIGVYLSGAEPVAQDDILHGVGEDDAEHEEAFVASALNLGAQSGGVAHAAFPEGGGERDGVAVGVEHGGGEARGGDAAEAESGRDKHGRDGVSGVELAVDNFIADGGPADLAAQLHVETTAAEKALRVRDEDGRGVGERDKAHAQAAGAHRWARGRGRASGGGASGGRSGHVRDRARAVPAGAGVNTAVHVNAINDESFSS